MAHKDRLELVKCSSSGDVVHRMFSSCSHHIVQIVVRDQIHSHVYKQGASIGPFLWSFSSVDTINLLR